MLIIYKEILEKLSKAGYSSYRLQKENLIPGSTLDRIRHGKSVSTNAIDAVCTLCKCQPGDILEWVPGKKEQE